MDPKPSSPLETLRRLYFDATERTIARDFQRAIEILKTLPTEEERERAAVYMEGLAEMRKEWAGGKAGPRSGQPGARSKSASREPGEHRRS